jgi:hypothetical protein
VNEEQPIAVCFRERFEDASGLFSDTEVVPEKRNHERGRIGTPRVLDAFVHCVYVINVYLDINGQKRIHSGLGSEVALYFSQ